MPAVLLGLFIFLERNIFQPSLKRLKQYTEQFWFWNNITTVINIKLIVAQRFRNHGIF